MKIIVLGAAAGGGLPQWNCRCASCEKAWRGGVVAQGQVSLAVSGNEGRSWVLINASPDLRAQILQTPALWPRDGQLRHSPIEAVVVVNGEIDAIAGLLSMREGHKFSLYAPEGVLTTLAQNSIFNVLQPANVVRRPLVLDAVFTPAFPSGEAAGFTIEAFRVPGKVAWYNEAAGDEAAARVDPGDTLGLTLRHQSGKVAHLILACAAMTPEVRARLQGADLVFFDGTLWHDEEMLEQGLAPKTGAGMGHMSISGEDGALAAFAPLEVARKVFVHINNSNPIWDHTSPERAALRAAGWSVPAPAEEFSL